MSVKEKSKPGMKMTHSNNYNKSRVFYCSQSQRQNFMCVHAGEKILNQDGSKDKSYEHSNVTWNSRPAHLLYWNGKKISGVFG